jgi:alanine racemase
MSQTGHFRRFRMVPVMSLMPSTATAAGQTGGAYQRASGNHRTLRLPKCHIICIDRLFLGSGFVLRSGRNRATIRNFLDYWGPGAVSNITTPSAQKAVQGPLLVNGSSDINGSVLNDTVVRRNGSLHVRGNLVGNLTIELGANVIVEGSVDGRIINRGGRLVVNNKDVKLDGPPEAEANGILKIDLTAVVRNWDTLAKRTEAECAAVVKGNAFGCGIDPVAAALARAGCKTFFVSDLTEAKRVRAVAPNSTIYVLNGLYPRTGPAFAEINARPVINSSIEMAEWDVFVSSRQWTGGCALNVNTGANRLGISFEEAVAYAPRVHSLSHGIALLMSRLDICERSNQRLNNHQIELFRDLRRLYIGVPVSLANSSGIFLDRKVHCDLVRAGGALYGVNPTPGLSNPMVPVIEMQARIVQVRTLAPGEAIADSVSRVAKRQTRLAMVSIGYADGYPRPAGGSDVRLQAVIGGHRCPIAGRPSMDLLPVDVTDLSDPRAARYGEMATLIGTELTIDDLASAAKTTGSEVLSRLGHRFHRIYYGI